MAKLRSFQLIKPEQAATKYPYILVNAEAYKKALSPSCKEALARADEMFKAAPCNVDGVIYDNVIDYIKALPTGLCPFK